MDSVYYEEEKAKRISLIELNRQLKPLLKPYKGRLALGFLLLILATTATITGPILIKRAVDVDIKNSDYSGLMVTAAIYMGIQIVFLILNYLQRINLEWIGQQAMATLRKRLFNHIVHMSMKFFNENPVGRLLSRVESDTESLRMLFTNTIVTLLGDFLLLVGMFGVMAYVDWRLTLILAALAPVILILTYYYQKITNPMFLRARKRMADIAAFLTEYIQGMSVVQIFNRGEQVRQKSYEVNSRKFKIETKAELMVVLFFNTVFFTETIAICLILWFGGKMALSRVITVGTLLMFIQYIRRFFEPIFHLSEQMHIIQKAMAGSSRIFSLLAHEQRVKDPESPLLVKPFEKSIVFENVSFAYKDEDWVLKEVSFELPKGKRYALIGVTGGGKTSIINVLLRFYEFQKGRILIDGIDIREMKLTDLRHYFGLVLQDIYLFPGNILDNLRLSDGSISEERVKKAASIISADKFVSGMKDGYASLLAERGGNLSMGERQLLSFARAMVFDPEILILDEATSSIDPNTEEKIQSALRRLQEGRTSLTIAHRLQTVLDADQILVIRRGEIIERGTHQQLLKLGGYYSDLFKLQFQLAKGEVKAYA
ncbi:MAG: antibiotic ABC transporter ATP-binding protein [candidate division Zixibacteria bacterium CG_4_9_14_3_um_filter_46_8]|nr:MAG: antibiotic ABC transporter ATP-binding protein [candidate division Zixibacteria bacterium CG_4_9_14_3_um_filter_46_8]